MSMRFGKGLWSAKVFGRAKGRKTHSRRYAQVANPER